jgi:hypothetical protein
MDVRLYPVGAIKHRLHIRQFMPGTIPFSSSGELAA